MSNEALSPLEMCPDGEELAAFEAGDLTPAQRQVIAEHLRACEGCRSNHKTLQANSEFAARLRRQPECGRSLLDDSACRELEALACAIAQEPIDAVTVSPDATARGDEAPSLPQVFGAYRLLEQLGHGGMGIVYKAEQESLHRLIALKMVRAGVYASQEERTRFQREGQAIARIRDDHVVQIHEFGQHDGQMFFVMELLEGGTLSGKLKGQPMKPRQAAELARTLAQGVQAAHNQGIIHRDLKPSNVLFAADGTAKIGDFGVAKIVDAADGATQTNVIMGTPNYMPPEQADGQARTLGPTADIYALGAILYEMLTGRPPFRAATILQTIELVRSSELKPPSRLRPGLPRDLEAICLKCLEKEPARRYASAASLADDLQRWLQNKPTQARPLGRVKRAGRIIRRHPRLSAAVLLLAALSVVASLVWYRNDPKRPLRGIEDRLRREEAVVLIGEKGKPAWYSVVNGSVSTRTVLGPDDVFTAHTWSRALVELLPDPRWQSYRMRAEVRHLKGVASTGVGIYVGSRQFPTSAGTVHSLLSWMFDDLNDIGTKLALHRKDGVLPQRQRVPRENQIELCSQMFLAAQADTKWGFSDSIMSGRIGISPGKWRRIALEVTPRRLRGFWEGKPIGEMPLDRLARSGLERMNNYHKRRPNNPFIGLDVIPFAPRGGVGLFVNEGSAAFRNVVLEPLEESE